MRPKQTFFLFLLLVACQSREVSPKISASDYYPLKTDTYWLYDVTETTITQLGGQSSVSYELKMQISDSVVASQQVTYVIKRSKRTDSNSPWVEQTTWFARQDEFQIIQQEGNTPFVKLSSPLSEGKSWNGNALNNLGGSDKCDDGTFNCDNYVSVNLRKRFEFANLFFDDTVTIQENNENDPIVEKDVRTAIYARTIGLVYRETTHLQYCTQGDCIGKQIVENGTIVKQTLKDHGSL